MPRVNLSISDPLFSKLALAAQETSTTVNLLIIDLLENLFLDTAAFNYSEALKTLVEEAEAYAKAHQAGEEFPLVWLESFSNICVAQAGKAKLRPSVVRARVGKLFNAMVRDHKVAGVSRATDKNGEKKFLGNAALYLVDKAKPPSVGPGATGENGCA